MNDEFADGAIGVAGDDGLVPVVEEAGGAEEEGRIVLPFPCSPTTQGEQRRKKEAPAKAKAEAQRRQKLLAHLFGTSPLKRFSGRLKREGRYDEYKERVKEIMAEGHLPGTAAKQARNEFGYEGAKRENELLEQEIAILRMTEVEMRQAQNARNYRARKKEMNFDEVLAALPMTAAIDVDMAWVQSHPAMMRRERMAPDEDGELPRIVLDVKDVLELNGRAPSKRAVIQLQLWVNKAQTFSVKMLDEAKKHTASTVGRDGDGNSAKSAVKDDRMSDIERLMDQLEENADGPVLP